MDLDQDGRGPLLRRNRLDTLSAVEHAVSVGGAVDRSSGFIDVPWPAPRWVRAASTTRRSPGASMPPYDRCNLGLRSGEDADIVRGNRSGLVSALALPSAPIWLHQVHGTDIHLADHPGPLDAEPQADAALTRQPGVVLAVLGADCLPVLFAADDASVVAVAHAGWRGLSGGVLERCLAALDHPPQRLLAWLGPAIGAAHYEVGANVYSVFIEDDPGSIGCFRRSRPGHWLCDLYGLARRRLQACGVMQVHGGDHCTYAQAGQFYSHRRDAAASGRQASLVWIAPT